MIIAYKLQTSCLRGRCRQNFAETSHQLSKMGMVVWNFWGSNGLHLETFETREDVYRSLYSSLMNIRSTPSIRFSQSLIPLNVKDRFFENAIWNWIFSWDYDNYIWYHLFCLALSNYLPTWLVNINMLFQKSYYFPGAWRDISCRTTWLSLLVWLIS